jgi:hypothetical protein
MLSIGDLVEAKLNILALDKILVLLVGDNNGRMMDENVLSLHVAS